MIKKNLLFVYSPSTLNLKFLLTGMIILFLPFFLNNPFQYEIYIIALLNSLLVLGLNLLLGYTGQISLAHGAFYMLSPYVTVILIEKFSFPLWGALLFSLFLVVLTLTLIAIPILKLKGHYLAMATLGVGLIIFSFLNNEVELTGGPDGLVVPSIIIGTNEISSPILWYYLSAIVFLFFLFWVDLLINSPWGILLKGIRENEKILASVGIEIHPWKVIVFSFSIFLAAIAGNLYAFYSGFISPHDANFIFSVELLAMVIIGGIGNIYGGILGAVLLTILPQVLTHFAEWKHLLLGVIIILIITFLPSGISGIGNLIRKRGSF